MVQSSVVGKSRTVKELGKYVVSIPICFREAQEIVADWPLVSLLVWCTSRDWKLSPANFCRSKGDVETRDVFLDAANLSSKDTHEGWQQPGFRLFSQRCFRN